MVAQETMEGAMAYVHKVSKKISSGMKTNDLMEVEAGHKLLEFGQEKQNEEKRGGVRLVRKESKFIVNFSKSVKVKGKIFLSK